MLARYAGSGGVYDGFLADLTVAWDDAAARDQATTCVRYALIATSVASVAANFPPALVAQALRTGLWDPSRALSAAAGAAGEELYRVALESGRLDRPTHVRAQRAALERVLAEELEHDRAEALTRLAPHLDGDRRDKALTAARALEEPDERVKALAALGAHDEALTAARTLENARERAGALTALLDGDDPDVLADALAAARSIDWDSDRVQALAALAARRHDIAEEAMQQALTLEDFDLAFDLQCVLPVLDDEQRERLIAAALPRISELPDIDRDWDLPRPVGLIALGPHLRGDDLAKARAIAYDLSGAGPVQSMRPQVLAALARGYEGPERAELLRDALGSTRDESYAPLRIDTFVAVADLLEGEERAAAIRAALEGARALWDWRAQRSDPSPRLQALSKLAPLLEGELLERALGAAGEIKDYEAQARALVTLAQSLDGDAREAAMQAAFDAAWRVRDDHMGMSTVEETFARLDGPVLATALDGAATLPVGGGFTSNRARAFIALIPRLEDDLLQRAYAAGRELEHAYDRAEVLTAVAARLTGAQRLEAARLALDAIPDISGAPHLRANAVRDLGPYLDGDLALEAWNLVVALEDTLSSYGAAALGAVAPRFDEDLVEEAVGAVAPLPDDDQVAALAGLVPKLDGAARRDALATAVRITLDGSDVHAEQAAAQLAPLLEGADQEAVLSRGLDWARGYGNDEMAADGLIALAPYLDATERSRAIRDAIARALQIRYPRLRAERIIAALAREALAPPDEVENVEDLACFAERMPELAPKVRALLLDRLSELRGRPRSDLLELIAQPALCVPPIVEPDRVAANVEEICAEWSWL